MAIIFAVGFHIVTGLGVAGLVYGIISPIAGESWGLIAGAGIFAVWLTQT